MLIVACDGLKGFPEAIEATWPNSIVQTCVVHLIRAAMRFVSYKDRKALAAAFRPMYTAPNAKAAKEVLEEFKSSELGQRYPAAVATWENAWEQFIPFLAFPPMLRRVIYTTNSIESLNYQLRKVTKNRGHFPNDEAAVKLLWLAICNTCGQTCPATRKGPRQTREPAQRPRATGPRASDHELETSVTTARDRLPRTDHSLPRLLESTPVLTQKA